MRHLAALALVTTACTPSVPPAAESPAVQEISAPADALDFAWAISYAPEGEPHKAAISVSRWSDNSLEFGATCESTSADFIVHRYVPAGTPSGPLTIATNTQTFTFAAEAAADLEGASVLRVTLASSDPRRDALIEALATPQDAFAIEAGGEREVIAVNHQDLAQLRQCLSAGVQ